MKKSLLYSLAVGAMLCCIPDAHADVPLSYYSSLNGKCGAELKTAVHELISQASMLEYGSGSKKTWWGFYVTDYRMNGSSREVIDRYSNDVRTYGSRGSAPSGMNIEHSFPKSWWGGTQNNAYKDLFNLMPCQQKINSSKSNYGMGIVTDATVDNGCTKVGDGANGFKLWEPADKWKGDFARGYMYMATAYQDFTWTSQGLNSLSTGAYPTLKEWAYKLYIQWAKQDKVDQIEIDRNEAVYGIQGNRNPYVDFPNLMEYVWGDSITTPFNINTTVKAGQVIDDGGQGGDDNDDGDKVTIVYNQSFLNNNGGCTAEGTPGIWNVTEKYGWCASGYINSACTESDASISTPEIDLTGYDKAEMVFEHAGNKFGSSSPANDCSVFVSVDGDNTTLSGVNWPAGTNWTFVSSGNLDLTSYCNKKIKIGFRYTSTTSVAGTWEIKNLKVTATQVNGVDTVSVDVDDENAPIEYYSIDGRRLNADTAKGLVIKRQGRKVTKMIIR